MMLRYLHLLLALVILLIAPTLAYAGPRADTAPIGTMYVNPQCSCCHGHANYLRANGFELVVEEKQDMSPIRQQYGVPKKLDGCHIMIVGGYVVEGHVSVASITKLLTERPKIKGISLPGMPDGSPGMTGRKSAPFTIYEISDGAPKVFAVE